MHFRPKRRFSELLVWAEANYDMVLIDAPPVLAARDAAIIGRKMSGAILVVQPEKNHRRLVIRAVDGLKTMGVEVLGVVANRVGGEKGGYYGDDHYGYGYGYGLDEFDDDEYQDTSDEYDTQSRAA